MARAATLSPSQAETTASTFMKGINSVYLAGLGVLASSQEKTREVYESMVDKGKGYENDQTKLLSRATHEAKEFGQQLEQRIQQTVTATLNRAGVPSRDEIQELIRRMEVLTEKVEELASK